MNDRQQIPRIALYVLSRHHLAFRIIERTLPANLYEIKACNHLLHELPNKNGWILVLDSQSVEEWPAVVSQNRLNGGRSIIVAHELPQSIDEEIRLLHLGIHGIVPSEKIEDDLPNAVDLVCKGGLWISRNALIEYVKRRETQLAGDCFTSREQQVIVFLMKGFSNKEIGNNLGISERTVKFHVSNILEKSNVKSRRELRRVPLLKDRSRPQRAGFAA
ncbi:MAG TPA: response regulator transcription factor [Candidatus Angelobacter sp.]|jgi:DNA-binding CsgD family transcriptional regulator|nr:response regulator transcription factor [Candidatus Angelobacter sp.]